MENIRLKSVSFDVDFRKSELTNYREYIKRTGIEVEKRGEAILFVSARLSQLVWILNYAKIDCAKSEQFLIDSRRWRIEGGEWNPLMLQNYANAVNLHIVGIKRFEDIMSERKAARAGGG